MPGVKGRSGGKNKKSAAQHIAEGTYRSDRHKVAIQSGDVTIASSADFLPMDDIEKEMLDMLLRVWKSPSVNIAIALSIFAHDLARYMNAKREFDISGAVSETATRRFIAPELKALDIALKNLRDDFRIFGVSATDQATIAKAASVVADRLRKPFNPGKPLE